MQLRWIYLYDKDTLSKIQEQSKELRKEETELEARGDKDVIPSSSFLGEYISLEGCELHHTRLAQRHKGLTLFSDEPRHKGLVHLPLLESFEAKSGAFTMSLGHTPTTELGAPQITNNLFTRNTSKKQYD